MTLYEVSGIRPYTSSDAYMRAWAQAFDACLTQFLANTGDTGQTDLSALLATTSASQSRGFRIYRFNDAEQATFPIFLKVEYGSTSGSGTANQTPAIWVTIGSGTDGAGTITGVLMERTHVTPTSSGLHSSTETGAVFISHLPGGFALGSWIGSPRPGACGPCFGVERFTHPATRARKNTGAFFWSATSAPQTRYRPFSTRTSSGLPLAPSTFLPIVRPQSIQTGVVNNQFPIYPLTVHSEEVNGPPTQVVGMMRGDVGEGGTFTFSMDGSSRTFKSFGTALGTQVGLVPSDGVGGYTEMGLAIAYD